MMTHGTISAANPWQRLVVLAAAAAMLPALGFAAARSPSAMLLLLGGLGFLLLLTATRSFALTVILVCGTVDLAMRLGGGTISPQGFLTIFYALGSWFLWLLHPRLTVAVARVVWPFALFVVWGFASALFWSTPTIAGTQNLLVFTAFVGLILLSAGASRTTPAFVEAVGPTLVVASAVAATLFLLRPLLATDALDIAMGPRSYALFALVGLAWHLAGWRGGSRTSLWAAVVTVLLILSSLSRTAFVVSLLLIPLAQLQPGSIRGWARLVTWTSLGAGLFYAAVSFVAPLRARFLEGDVALQVGGVAINAMGRTNVWDTTWSSFMEAPWFGQGAGSAQAVILDRYGGIEHPHNDYLRILHDYGAVGFSLWVLGFVALLSATARAGFRADRRGTLDARIHMAAFLGSLSVALAMLTDNVIIYVFVVAPVAVLVGTSLGIEPHSSPRRDLQQASVAMPALAIANRDMRGERFERRVMRMRSRRRLRASTVTSFATSQPLANRLPETSESHASARGMSTVPAQARPRLAILTNVVAPYRVPLYQYLGERYTTLVVTSGREDNRRWDGQMLGSGVQMKSAWGITLKRRTRSTDGRTIDLKYMHLNPGYLWELRRFRPDAIITTEAGFRTMLGIVYGRLRGVPVWVWWGGTVHTEQGVSVVKRVLRRAVLRRVVERWISYGQASTDYLRRVGVRPERVLQIQNCVDDRLYRRRVEPYPIPVAPPRALVVGQLIGRKGIFLLLEATAAIHRMGLRCSLVVVGDGPEAERFKEEARRLGIHDLHHIPSLHPEEMAAVYQTCDFLIFPTLEDIWGLVVNEALLSGLPVIASVYAGCAKELLPPENIFDPLDQRDFVGTYRRAILGQIAPPNLAPIKSANEVADLVASDVSRRIGLAAR